MLAPAMYLHPVSLEIRHLSGHVHTFKSFKEFPIPVLIHETRMS